ncbi:VOC family protein [Streptomyces cinnabarinus]|uniref:VOC family protein n=1 Tax=Streptomyces cinnabarinus TaxID=67287 RepID=A0ABY7KCW1_9ACTN|nr:VOC family protein [Streptomyces cinnabarinus]WAZ22179.1 VOC family protein [Streptomyces cinnabarinus]
MPVARFRSVVIDCPEPLALAEFYAALLGGTPQVQEEDWVVLEAPGVPRLAFNREPGFRPPAWPREGGNAQQFHLDLDAGSTWADVDAAERRVLALGARPLKREEDPVAEDFRVYADPAGHPFCLCRIDHP